MILNAILAWLGVGGVGLHSGGAIVVNIGVERVMVYALTGLPEMDFHL
ncbi:MAG: hypothetical protein JXA78_12820 [Anaerolineales bacterium]|nr:hypothetical protein [Anaerolineales bacterium]